MRRHSVVGHNSRDGMAWSPSNHDELLASLSEDWQPYQWAAELLAGAYGERRVILQEWNCGDSKAMGLTVGTKRASVLLCEVNDAGETVYDLNAHQDRVERMQYFLTQFQAQLACPTA